MGNSGGFWTIPRCTRRWRSIVAGGICTLLCVPVTIGQIASPHLDWRAAHAQAVARYRTGDPSAALAQLQALLAQGVGDPLVRFDAVVVAAAADQAALAVSLATPLSLGQTPSYVLESLGKAARVARAYARSREAYSELLARDGKNIDAAVGRALALLSENRVQDAEAALAGFSVAADSPHRLAFLEVNALIAQARNQDVEVLRWAGDMLAIEPENVSAARLQFGAALRLGLPHVAAALIDTARLPAADRLRLGRDLLVFESRYQSPGETPSELRFRMDNVIAELRAFEAANRENQEGMRARWDLIALLLARGDHDSALALLTPMLGAKNEFPAWFLSTVGQTLVTARRPQEGLPWFDRAFAAGIDDNSSKIGYFYGLLEAEHTARAVAYAETLRAEAARKVQEKRADPNTVLDADLLRVQALYYTDQRELAWAELEKLRKETPANRELNRLRIELLAARGYPRQAMELLLDLLGETPNDVGLLTQQANLQFQLGERTASHATLAHAQVNDPEARAVLRTLRDFARSDAAVLRLDMTLGQTIAQGEPTINGARERRIEMSGYTPWWRKSGRLWATAFEALDEPSATNLNQRRGVLVGGQLRLRDLDASLSLSADRESPNRTYGATLRAAYDLSDEWQVGLALGRNDAQLPLRAWRTGTDMNYATASARWSVHPLHRLSGSLSTAQFSDDNARVEAALALQSRWWSRAHTKLDTRLDAYWTRNDRDDVPYFSPLRRAGAVLSVRGDWIQWRDYAKSWTHIATALVGRDWQRGVRSTDAYGLRYGHSWTLSRCTRLNYGVEWLRRGYDGRPETKRAASLSFEHQFMP